MFRLRAFLIAAGVLPVLIVFLTFSSAAVADASSSAGDAADVSVFGMADTSSVSEIGRLHENLRRARLRRLRGEAADLYDEYTKFKQRVEEEDGLSWSMDASYLQQWGRPDGGSPAGQVLLTPNVEWKLFGDSKIGEGSVQFAYIAARYTTTRNGADIQNALGAITPVNDYPEGTNIFYQLTYTYAFPGNRLLVGIGQYPFANFDYNDYLGNQQQNFNSYVFAQNGTQAYPNAGLGAFAQWNATSTLQFAAGFQNAANPSATTLSGKGFGSDGFAWFAYAQWTPMFGGAGTSQYSITYYEVPAIATQPRTNGWSFNALQNLDARWAVFARANRLSGDVAPIRGSYALGGAINDPLGRSPTDQIALAIGYSDAASPPANPPGARNEKLAELYWNWTFAKGLLLTPDVQYIRSPALNPARDSVWVFSLRATLMF